MYEVKVTVCFYFECSRRPTPANIEEIRGKVSDLMSDDIHVCLDDGINFVGIDPGDYNKVEYTGYDCVVAELSK